MFQFLTHEANTIVRHYCLRYFKCGKQRSEFSNDSIGGCIKSAKGLYPIGLSIDKALVSSCSQMVLESQDVALPRAMWASSVGSRVQAVEKIVPLDTLSSAGLTSQYLITPQKPNIHSGKKLYPAHPWMSIMQLLKYCFTTLLGNNDPRSPQSTTIIP